MCGVVEHRHTRIHMKDSNAVLVNTWLHIGGSYLALRTVDCIHLRVSEDTWSTGMTA
jgi:hypothetical protein